MSPGARALTSPGAAGTVTRRHSWEPVRQGTARAGYQDRMICVHRPCRIEIVHSRDESAFGAVSMAATPP